MSLDPFGPQPGSKRFLHYFAIILILFLVLFFLYKMDQMGRDAERVSVEIQVKKINIVLASIVYRFAINQELYRLQEMDMRNPFSLEGIDIEENSNYYGEVERISEMLKKGGWYFLKDDNTLHYIPNYEALEYVYQLHFKFSDLNLNGVYEPEQDQLDGFLIEPIKKP